MSEEDYKSFVSNRKRKISNEIKFYNKYIDDKCQAIVASMIDRTFPLAQILREEKVTYMAPILFKRHRCNSVTRKLSIGKDFCDRLELVDCEVKVLDQAIIHSIRNLIDRCTKILSLIYPLTDDQKHVGFGHKCAGFLQFALTRVNDDDLCKYIIEQYNEWIRDFCLTDNNIKHNDSLKSAIDLKTWRDKYGVEQTPVVIMPTHYITKSDKQKETFVEIFKMDEYIDRCYSLTNQIIDEVYHRLSN